MAAASCTFWRTTEAGWTRGWSRALESAQPRMSPTACGMSPRSLGTIPMPSFGRRRSTAALRAAGGSVLIWGFWATLGCGTFSWAEPFADHLYDGDAADHAAH